MKEHTLAENLYDIMKVCALQGSDDSKWAELSRKHAEEARQELYDYLCDKHIEWDGDNSKIIISDEDGEKQIEEFTISVHKTFSNKNKNENL